MTTDEFPLEHNRAVRRDRWYGTAPRPAQHPWVGGMVGWWWGGLGEKTDGWRGAVWACWVSGGWGVFCSDPHLGSPPSGELGAVGGLGKETEVGVGGCQAEGKPQPPPRNSMARALWCLLSP